MRVGTAARCVGSGRCGDCWRRRWRCPLRLGHWRGRSVRDWHWRGLRRRVCGGGRRIRRGRGWRVRRSRRRTIGALRRCGRSAVAGWRTGGEVRTNGGAERVHAFGRTEASGSRCKTGIGGGRVPGRSWRRRRRAIGRWVGGTGRGLPRLRAGRRTVMLLAGSRRCGRSAPRGGRGRRRWLRRGGRRSAVRRRGSCRSGQRITAR